jgi:protein HIRA/HIR1
MCALGSSDRLFTVWSLQEPQPLTEARAFFSSCVMDVAWTPDGMSLLACSYDGTVAAIHFTAEEIGE